VNFGACEFGGVNSRTSVVARARKSHVWNVVLALAAAGCGRGAATAVAFPGDGGAEVLAEGAAASPARDPLTEELWERAADGELADLARLLDREGETELIERATLPAYRMTALAALGCADDFTPLPFLADIASTGTDAEAALALQSAERLAALPERTRDPEDALELRQGCDRLVALAREATVPISRRARAVSVLRMLASTGCIKGDAIPVDLDPK
jgi:hypothetical protein